MRTIELLAPAGSMETLKAAVQAGADAVYLAGPRFGARSSAENFTHETLKEAIDYCHIRGVKVYGAVNTLIKPSELQEALDEVGALYTAQIDAVILQDWGLVRLVKEAYPDLELHGSTQMTLYDAEGVRQALKLGLNRVVIARETSLSDIRSIVEATGASIEAFVHGALCYSYSGQCLISSQIGGRSGNRGRCAQPCRRKYKLRQGTDGSGKLIRDAYPLSTRDLMTLDRLEELVSAGIASLKIEGRLRKSDYVSAVVAAYRQELDRIQALKASALQGVPDLGGVFNRETTVGRIFGAAPDEVLTTKGPGNMGQLVGKTSGYDRYRKQLFITLSGGLRTGDGIKVLAGKDEPGAQVNGLFVDREKVQRAGAGQRVAMPFETWVPEGCEVRKTLDIDMGKAAQQFALSNQRKVALWGELDLQIGQKARLTVGDAEGNTVLQTSEMPLEAAQNQGADPERIREQVLKTGETPYVFSVLTVQADPQVFAPVKVLNTLRRDALQAMDRLRAVRYPRGQAVSWSPPGIEAAKTTDKPGVSVTVCTLDQLIALKGLSVSRVDYTDLPTLKSASELALSMGLKLCAAVPALSGQRNLGDIRKTLGEAAWQGPIRIGSLGQLALTSEAQELIGDHTFNATNPQALDLLNAQGLARICLSPELSREELLTLAPYQASELLVYGRLVVMTSPLCPVQCPGPCSACGGQRFTLEDEKGYIFPARCRDGLFEVMNSRILNLIDAIGGFPAKSFGSYRLDFDTESPEQVRRIVRSFLAVLAGYEKPRDTDGAFKAELHTAGAFRHGVE